MRKLHLVTASYLAIKRLGDQVDGRGPPPVRSSIGCPRFFPDVREWPFASKTAPYGLLKIEDWDEFTDRYIARLDRLAAEVDEQLRTIARDHPRQALVLCCFEKLPDILAGETFCHRHLLATWLEERLDIAVPELEHGGRVPRRPIPPAEQRAGTQMTMLLRRRPHRATAARGRPKRGRLMPYIVTSRTPYMWQGNGPNANAGRSRRAVTTLDEAVAEGDRRIIEQVGHRELCGDLFSDRRAFDDPLPWTIDPLPDGTVIEVEQVSYIALRNASGAERGACLRYNSDETRAAVIDAYNEAMSRPDFLIPERAVINQGDAPMQTITATEQQILEAAEVLHGMSGRMGGGNLVFALDLTGGEWYSADATPATGERAVVVPVPSKSISAYRAEQIIRETVEDANRDYSVPVKHVDSATLAGTGNCVAVEPKRLRTIETPQGGVTHIQRRHEYRVVALYGHAEIASEYAEESVLAATVEGMRERVAEKLRGS